MPKFHETCQRKISRISSLSIVLETSTSNGPRWYLGHSPKRETLLLTLFSNNVPRVLVPYCKSLRKWGTRESLLKARFWLVKGVSHLTSDGLMGDLVQVQYFLSFHAVERKKMGGVFVWYIFSRYNMLFLGFLNVRIFFPSMFACVNFLSGTTMLARFFQNHPPPPLKSRMVYHLKTLSRNERK